MKLKKNIILKGTTILLKAFKSTVLDEYTTVFKKAPDSKGIDVARQLVFMTTPAPSLDTVWFYTNTNDIGKNELVFNLPEQWNEALKSIEENLKPEIEVNTWVKIKPEYASEEFKGDDYFLVRTLKDENYDCLAVYKDSQDEANGWDEENFEPADKEGLEKWLRVKAEEAGFKVGVQVKGDSGLSYRLDGIEMYNPDDDPDNISFSTVAYAKQYGNQFLVGYNYVEQKQFPIAMFPFNFNTVRPVKEPEFKIGDYVVGNSNKRTCRITSPLIESKFCKSGYQTTVAFANGTTSDSFNADIRKANREEIKSFLLDESKVNGFEIGTYVEKHEDYKHVKGKITSIRPYWEISYGDKSYIVNRKAEITENFLVIQVDSQGAYPLDYNEYRKYTIKKQPVITIGGYEAKFTESGVGFGCKFFTKETVYQTYDVLTTLAQYGLSNPQIVFGADYRISMKELGDMVNYFEKLKGE